MTEILVLDTSQFSPEEVASLKSDFIGNECGTDEYRETQPTKGIHMVAQAFSILEDNWFKNRFDSRLKGSLEETKETYYRLLELFKKWVVCTGTWYDGDEELEPVLDVVFDILWANGEHPYEDSTEDLKEWLKDFPPEEVEEPTNTERTILAEGEYMPHPRGGKFRISGPCAVTVFSWPNGTTSLHIERPA